MEFTVPPMVAELVKEGRVSVTALFLKNGVDAYCTVEKPLEGVPTEAGKTILPSTLEGYLEKRKGKKNQKELSRQENLFKKLKDEVDKLDDCDKASGSRDFAQLSQKPRKASLETRLAIAAELNRKMYAQRRRWEREDLESDPDGRPFEYHPKSDDDPLTSVRIASSSERYNISRHVYEHVLTEDVVKGMTLAQAEQRIVDRKLGLQTVTRESDGEEITNIVPLKSLCVADAARGIESRADLQARVIKVTASLGSDTILGRIRSTEALRIRGASDLAEWWSKASGQQRFELLTDKKNRDLFLKESIDWSISFYAMLFKQPCPFLGAAPLLV